MKILVSACLLGVNCRYAGDGKADERVLDLMEKHTLIPVCPEQMGGLATPRPPAERLGDRIVNLEGEDVTEYYERGAGEALALAKLCGCRCAVLKEKSPSCGSGLIHDGSFTGKLTEGFGVTAQLLMENGVAVFGEGRVDELKGEISGESREVG